MITTELSIYEEARQLVAGYINKANVAFNSKIPVPDIKWDLTGTAAGQAVSIRVCGNWQASYIRLNRGICLAQREEFMKRTVGHEVAHIVAQSIYRNIRPHGREWQRVMHIFGLEASRCHSYDTSKAKKRGGSYPYKCACTTYQLTITRHRRVVNKESFYTCRKCNTRLSFAGVTATQS